jgi:hypothetical protein
MATAAAAGEHTVEQQLAAVREKTSQCEDQLDRAQDREMLLVLHQRLVKLQEKELLLMQRQQPGKPSTCCRLTVGPACTLCLPITVFPQVNLKGRLIC